MHETAFVVNDVANRLYLRHPTHVISFWANDDRWSVLNPPDGSAHSYLLNYFLNITILRPLESFTKISKIFLRPNNLSSIYSILLLLAIFELLLMGF